MADMTNTQQPQALAAILTAARTLPVLKGITLTSQDPMAQARWLTALSDLQKAVAGYDSAPSPAALPTARITEGFCQVIREMVGVATGEDADPEFDHEAMTLVDSWQRRLRVACAPHDPYRGITLNASATSGGQGGAEAFNSVLAEVAAERRRQIEVEGNSIDQDDGYTMGELVRAAVSYIKGFPESWPWGMKWWKPKDERRNLIRALALLTAEVERLDRAALRERGEGSANG